MKRKLVELEAFKNIEKNSITYKEVEIKESKDVLADVLGLSELNFHCLNEDVVYFKNGTSNFVKANYEINESNVVFNNIEEIVLDENTIINEGRKCLAEMIDAVIEDKKDVADKAFVQFMENRRMTRNMGPRLAKKKMRSLSEDRACKAKHKAMKVNAPGKVNEWSTVAKNILEYVHFMNNDSVLSEVNVKKDANGNPVAIKMPCKQLRNESRLYSLQLKTLKSEIKDFREEALKLHNDLKFCRMINGVKLLNNISDADRLEESISQLVSKYPSLVYLTESELSNVINRSLQTVGSHNFDDQTCEFMAEGLLRYAHSLYSDRVERVLELAKAKPEGDDEYLAFQETVSKFYNELDETLSLEKHVFEDLHKAISQVHEITKDAQSAKLLESLSLMLADEAELDLDLAKDAAEWLNAVVKESIKDADWEIVTKPYVTKTGEHPDMITKSKADAQPSDYINDVQGVGQLDDEGAKPASSRPRGVGANTANTYPNISKNPCLLDDAGAEDQEGTKLGDYKTDTYPNIRNPYLPASIVPGRVE